LDGGELLVTFDRGQGAEALDYRTWLTRSADGGATWSTPVRLVPGETARPSTHSLRIGRAADGTLLAIGGRHWRDDPEEGIVNRANMGFVPMDVIATRSTDGGRTWSEPAVVQPPLVGPAF